MWVISLYAGLLSTAWPLAWGKAVSLTFFCWEPLPRAQEVLWARKVLQKSRSHHNADVVPRGIMGCDAWRIERFAGPGTHPCLTLGWSAEGKSKSTGEGLAFCLNQEWWVSKAGLSAWFISISANVDEHRQLGMTTGNRHLLKAQSMQNTPSDKTTL